MAADVETNNGYFLSVEIYGTNTIVLKKADKTLSPIILGGPFSFVRFYETEECSPPLVHVFKGCGKLFVRDSRKFFFSERIKVWWLWGAISRLDERVLECF